MLDFLSADHHDLRSSRSPWAQPDDDLRDPDPADGRRCDVLVVGGGITGSLIAEHLSARGRGVCVIDRERPGLGSTAASTAMLQWEIDAPLAELARGYGFERASTIYRRSLRAVEGLSALARSLGAPCGFKLRPTLYLGGGDEGPDALQAEHALRKRAGLPGRYLDRGALLSRFGFDRPAAILSPGSAEADPLCLAHGLLLMAKRRGAPVLGGEAVAFEPHRDGVDVELACGARLTAAHVVLATGYIMPDFVPSHLHSVTASWALKTPPQDPDALWPGGALIWEASHPYLYARTTADGGIIVGGEDEPVADAGDRDDRVAAKVAILKEKLARLWPRAAVEAAVAWSGVFGETEDGLPLIGRVPGMPRVYAAYGYGGNGITFSFMASRMIAEMIEDRDRPWFKDFALDRPRP